MWAMSPNLRIKLKKRLKSDWGQKMRRIYAEEKTLEREGGRELQHLSTIYGDRLVGIRRAKNESSSTRRGLRVGIENTGFL